MFHFPEIKKCGSGVRIRVIRMEHGAEDVTVRDFVSNFQMAEYMASSLNRDRHIPKAPVRL